MRLESPAKCHACKPWPRPAVGGIITFNNSKMSKYACIIQPMPFKLLFNQNASSTGQPLVGFSQTRAKNCVFFKIENGNFLLSPNELRQTTQFPPIKRLIYSVYYDTGVVRSGYLGICGPGTCSSGPKGRSSARLSDEDWRRSVRASAAGAAAGLSSACASPDPGTSCRDWGRCSSRSSGSRSRRERSGWTLWSVAPSAGWVHVPRPEKRCCCSYPSPPETLWWNTSYCCAETWSSLEVMQTEVRRDGVLTGDYS